MRTPIHAGNAPALAKWCAYAVILLMPGSFVALPLWWYWRYRTQQRAVKSNG